MKNTLPYLGELFALLTAITWAVGVILFKKSGETAHPLALNFFKNILSLMLILPTLYLFGETPALPVSHKDYLLLLFSGAVGIGIADTLFFKSLNLLGAGLFAVIDCLYSPAVICLSVLWLGERMTLWQIFGAAVIVSAVLTVIGKDKSVSISRRERLTGICYGITATVLMGVSIVIVKPLIERFPILWLTQIRLTGGLLILGCLLLLNPKRYSILSSLFAATGWKYMLSGSFAGTYLTLIFWQYGMKFTQASVVAALNQTSTVFIFVLAAVFLREPITARRTFSIFLGVAGSLMVIFL